MAEPAEGRVFGALARPVSRDKWELLHSGAAPIVFGPRRTRRSARLAALGLGREIREAEHATRVRTFFFICGGILSLSAGLSLWHNERPEPGCVSVNTTIALDQAGRIWMLSNNGGTSLAGPFQLPKPGQVVAIDGWGGVYALVPYADRDHWEGDVSGGGPMRWRLRGNLLSGGPIPTQRETWGRIKADRR